MTEYIRIPIFSNNSLTGYFRYKDEFQIYPFKSSFQDIPEDSTAKPMLLEISFERLNHNSSSKNINKIIEELKIDTDALNVMTPAYNKTISILRLLTIFTNFKFYNYTSQKCWLLGANNKSVWGEKKFYYPELEKEFPRSITCLTKGLEFEKIYETSYADYFIKPKLDPSQKIIFQSEVSNLFDKYFSLESKKRKRIDAICSLFYRGINLFKSSKSLSFVAFTSCIEALTSIEYEAENNKIKYSCNSCKRVIESPYKCECGEPVWGISYKFKQLLSTYVSNSSGSISTFNKLYSLRCKIVHDGQLFIADSLFDWEKDEKAEEEWRLLSQMQQITRIAIINWLLYSTLAN
jgi:hypothetical protein